MAGRNFFVTGAVVVVATAGTALGAAAFDGAAQPAGSKVNPAQQAMSRLLTEKPGAAVYEHAGKPTTIYGRAFAAGRTAAESSGAFLAEYALALGTSTDDLLPGSLAGDGEPERGLVWLPEEGRYKFTLTSYLQHREGVPVWRADVRLLTRNEPGNPLVLVRNATQDLGGFEVPVGVEATLISWEQVRDEVTKVMPTADTFGEPRLVIYAGYDGVVAAPRFAYEIVAEAGVPTIPITYQKNLFLIDAVAGGVIHRESQIVFHGGGGTDITGVVEGTAADGALPAVFTTQSLTPLPYARVSSTSTGDVFAGVGGDYAVSGAANGTTVSSMVRGQWFRTFNQAGSDVTLSSTPLNPPAAWNFAHNTPSSPQQSAAVDAYIHANVARDMVLSHNPAYPQLQQAEFTVNVNINDDCNAFYNGNSINFYLAGGGCVNTAYSTVVHHEYGHHIVAVAGSGQGQYGEGFGDCMGVTIMDMSGLALGFQGNPAVPLRDADNTVVYPCTGAIHSCGRLLSGCVWDTRNAMVLTEPGDYLQILQSLLVNANLLHTGNLITPQITIDWLTLDDDDSDILNGTPHYNEINAGFGAHNMPGPELALLSISYPAGRPSIIDPAGGTSLQIDITGLSAQPQPGTAQLFYDAGSGFTSIPLTAAGGDSYTVEFPAADCGTLVDYYVTVQTTSAVTVFSPSTAPAETFSTIAATSEIMVFSDDFETDQGWQVGAPGDDATTGIWERGDPVGTAAQPEDDHSPGGTQCFFTGQGVPGGSLGANDVDGGVTTLISPMLDLSDTVGPTVSFWAWYSNTTGAAPNADVFQIDVSSNGGTTWTNAITVGPAGPATSGGWFSYSFRVADFVTPTDQVRIRFRASDEGSGSIIEAAVDDVVVTGFACDEEPTDRADWNGDGEVNTADFFEFFAAFFGVPPDADFNGDGSTDTADFFEFFGCFFSPGTCLG